MTGMIGALIGIIFALVILGVIWWAIQQLLPMIPLGEPFATIVRILMTVIMVLIVLWVIVVLLGMAGIHVPMPFRSELPGRSFAALPAWSSLDLQRLLTHG
jgi:hypothetical protein